MIMDTDTLEGVQPLELGFQEWQSGRLKTLDCYWDTVSCNLSTEFPISIINLDSLKYLDLQNNALTDTIPNEISNLYGLEYIDMQYNNLSGYLPESLCIDDTTVWTDINLKNNQFCPCYPECINKVYSNFVTDQDTSDCSYCNDGYTQICDKHPGSISTFEGDPRCFNTDNLAVLEAFIDNSQATLPDSLDNMDADSSDTIEPLEIGIQVWENGKLISFDARNHGLSGGIPENIGSLNSLIYLLIIFLLAIMFIATAKADLIKPNNNIEPYQVVKIQLKSLKQNDKPTKDNGIEQTWEFAHPNNQKNTGPLDRFKTMIKSKSYEMLLNHLDHKVVEVESGDLTSLFEVTVLDQKKAYYKFNWQVEKYTEEGPLNGCWLTTIVSAPAPLGSSI